MIPKISGVAYQVSNLSKFPNKLLRLVISLTLKHRDLYDKKLDNNDAWRLASLSFIVGEATSSTSTLITLILIKFPMISEVPKQFSSENGCNLDVHNTYERGYSINYLFNMTKWRF